MDDFYVVLEVQNSGTPAVLPTVYTDINQALAKYHTVLAAAAVAQLPYHGCFVLRASDGTVIYGEIMRHTVQAAEE